MRACRKVEQAECHVADPAVTDRLPVPGLALASYWRGGARAGQAPWRNSAGYDAFRSSVGTSSSVGTRYGH
jgi:hypothetical protein